MRLWTIALLLLLPCLPHPALAGCTGSNQIDLLAEADRAALIAAADDAPFAQGNLWQARRGDAVIVLFGTLHTADPRNDAVMARLLPLIGTAATVLVEAGPAEEAALMAAMAENPALMFLTEGPTLRESLPPELWNRVKDALRDIGIPPFFGAKMQPAYLAMLLGVPACAANDMAAGATGLDGRIVAQAEALGLPVRALEPFDTLFRIVDGLSSDEQLGLLDVTLAMTGQADDAYVTLTDAYYAERARRVWELARLQATRASSRPAAEVAADFAAMEEALILTRNRAWIPVIEAAAAEGPVFAAFGALHLSGQDGVLALLARRGYAVERLPL